MGHADDKTLELLSMMDNDEKAVYEPVLTYLTELGYRPQKQYVQGYVLSFKHRSHGNQIAKAGVRGKEPKAFLALRFSACENYSQKFADVVKNIVLSKGEQYQATQWGVCKRCGAYVLEIPNVSADDVREIKKLIDEQHEYFVKYTI